MTFECINSEKSVDLLIFYLLKYIIVLMKVVLEEGRKEERSSTRDWVVTT